MLFLFSLIYLRNAVRLGDLPQDPAGRPDGDHPRGDVARDDAPGADHRVVADRHALHHHRVAPDPDVVADGNGQRTHDARVALVGQQGVADGVEPHVGTDEDVVPDRHGGLVEDRQVEIADEMVADRDLLPEVAVERAVDGEIPADAPEQPADDRFALFAAARGQPVEFEDQFLGTPQGFAAEAASATTILVSSHMGFALSTTQVCSGSIIGTGLGKPGNKVNWGVAARMLVAWLVTFPAAGLVGAAACALAKTGLGGTIAVAFIAVGAALVIFRLSKRNPVNSGNVNESSEVKIKASTSTKVATAA